MAGGPCPGPVEEEGLAALALAARRVVSALAAQLARLVRAAPGRVSVALAAPAHGQVRDRVAGAAVAVQGRRRRRPRALRRRPGRIPGGGLLRGGVVVLRVARVSRRRAGRRRATELRVRTQGVFLGLVGVLQIQRVALEHDKDALSGINFHPHTVTYSIITLPYTVIFQFFKVAF